MRDYVFGDWLHEERGGLGVSIFCHVHDVKGRKVDTYVERT